MQVFYLGICALVGQHTFAHCFNLQSFLSFFIFTRPAIGFIAHCIAFRPLFFKLVQPSASSSFLVIFFLVMVFTYLNLLAISVKGDFFLKFTCQISHTVLLPIFLPICCNVFLCSDQYFSNLILTQLSIDPAYSFVKMLFLNYPFLLMINKSNFGDY